MQIYGIRIFDSENDVLSVRISEILKEIKNGNDFNWSILFLDGTPSSGQGNAVNEYKKNINSSKEGFKTNWGEVLLIEEKFFQLFEVIILGCKNKQFLHRYNEDRDMYRSCDVVIELIDCAFWQIFSADAELMNRIQKKFKSTEIVQPDSEETSF